MTLSDQALELLSKITPGKWLRTYRDVHTGSAVISEAFEEEDAAFIAAAPELVRELAIKLERACDNLRLAKHYLDQVYGMEFSPNFTEISEQLQQPLEGLK